MNKRKNKALWIVILIVSALICIACIAFLAIYFFADSSIAGSILSTDSTQSQSDTSNETIEATQAPTERFAETTAQVEEYNTINFEDARKINSDIYAWIYIPNTNVDLPVAQSTTDDDSFYLTHNVYKNYQFSGTIYSEKQNAKDFSDPVTVLYGHNMLNGSMFASLHNFNDKDFFDKNNTIFIFTEDTLYTYLIYSAYQYDDRHILNSFEMSDPSDFRLYLDSTLEQRPYYCNIRDGITLREDDHILTLSTCMPGGGNVRYLVQGVLVNEQQL